MSPKKSYVAAYQGIDGAYSQEAVFEYFGKEVPTLGCASFDEVVAAVESGEAQYGFLPAENSAAGTIVQTYDLLRESNLLIVGEHYLPVHHHLMVLPEVRLEDVKVVYSHPQALAQCAQTIRRFGFRAEATWATAGS
ncbi:MAG TPA: bifunctional chorismate mutase/prephenate dehydratase, partial [Bacteroidetes bacterium]|nr:bifunctional chorismate mutase/prephenate dehydratase [Bacteroidota bacterium]